MKLVPELYVSDLRKTLSFYVDVLGFNVLYERTEDKFAYLQREGAEMMFEQITKESSWLVGKLKYPLGGGINFQIETSRIDKLHQKVKRNNIKFFLDLEEKCYRRNNELVGNKQFMIQDPDGYLLRFYEDLGTRPRSVDLVQ